MEIRKAFGMVSLKAEIIIGEKEEVKEAVHSEKAPGQENDVQGPAAEIDLWLELQKEALDSNC